MGNFFFVLAPMLFAAVFAGCYRPPYRSLEDKFHLLTGHPLVSGQTDPGKNGVNLYATKPGCVMVKGGTLPALPSPRTGQIYYIEATRSRPWIVIAISDPAETITLIHLRSEDGRTVVARSRPAHEWMTGGDLRLDGSDCWWLLGRLAERPTGSLRLAAASTASTAGQAAISQEFLGEW